MDKKNMYCQVYVKITGINTHNLSVNMKMTTEEKGIKDQVSIFTHNQVNTHRDMCPDNRYYQYQHYS